MHLIVVYHRICIICIVNRAVWDLCKNNFFLLLRSMYFYDVGNLNLSRLFIRQNYFTVYNTYYHVTTYLHYKNNYEFSSTFRFFMVCRFLIEFKSTVFFFYFKYWSF